jgi:hypothetical protein
MEERAVRFYIIISPERISLTERPKRFSLSPENECKIRCRVSRWSYCVIKSGLFEQPLESEKEMKLVMPNLSREGSIDIVSAWQHQDAKAT